MFMIIFEDGTVKRLPSVANDDISACDDGYCQLIDISHESVPKEYLKGEWVDIPFA
jgi:hypothetical protein